MTFALPALDGLAGALTTAEPQPDETLVVSRVWTSSDRRAVVSLQSKQTGLFWSAWVPELSPVAEGEKWWDATHTGKTIMAVKKEGTALAWTIYEQSGLRIATPPGKNSIGTAIRDGRAPAGYTVRTRPTVVALVGAGVGLYFAYRWFWR